MDTKNDQNSIFREKSLAKAADPEQLGKYLKVTGVGAWLVVLAGVGIVASILLWAALGRLDNLVKGAAECTDGILTCYFRSVDIGDIETGMKVSVDDRDYVLEEIKPRRYLAEDLPRDVLYFSQKSDWYQAAVASCDLEDGVYEVTVTLDSLSPISFLTKGE